MNYIGGILKNFVYSDVMYGKSVIEIPKPFAEHADKQLKL